MVTALLQVERRGSWMRTVLLKNYIPDLTYQPPGPAQHIQFATFNIYFRNPDLIDVQVCEAHRPNFNVSPDSGVMRDEGHALIPLESVRDTKRLLSRFVGECQLMNFNIAFPALHICRQSFEQMWMGLECNDARGSC